MDSRSWGRARPRDLVAGGHRDKDESAVRLSALFLITKRNLWKWARRGPARITVEALSPCAKMYILLYNFDVELRWPQQRSQSRKRARILLA